MYTDNRSFVSFVQEYFEEAKERKKVINHKANRKRAVLKNSLTFAGKKSGDTVQGDGDSKKCFEPNSNYRRLFLNTYIS